MNIDKSQLMKDSWTQAKQDAFSMRTFKPSLYFSKRLKMNWLVIKQKILKEKEETQLNVRSVEELNHLLYVYDHIDYHSFEDVRNIAKLKFELQIAMNKQRNFRGHK